MVRFESFKTTPLKVFDQTPEAGVFVKKKKIEPFCSLVTNYKQANVNFWACSRLRDNGSRLPG